MIHLYFIYIKNMGFFVQSGIKYIFRIIYNNIYGGIIIISLIIFEVYTHFKNTYNILSSVYKLQNNLKFTGSTVDFYT